MLTEGFAYTEPWYHFYVAKPSVLIGTPFGNSFSVPLGFHKSMVSLVRYSVGHDKTGKVNTMLVEGADVAKNRNLIAKEGVKYDYMLQIDSDMVFEKDYLLRLLELSSKFPDCVISGLAFLGNEPHLPAIFKDEGERKVNVTKWPGGPFEVDVVGGFGFLVPKNILNTIGLSPFSRIDGLQEDFSFCNRVRFAGFRIVVEPGLELGHIRPKEIRGDDFHA